MGKLKIYQASAGSGKTYTLALEYILLLFKHHDLYRNILAVTFTNKAAGEMKGRVMEKLYRMSIGDEEDYSKKIQNILKIKPAEIKTQSKKILKHILHNYSRFSIQTIDSFFQKIIRSFAMELGLQYSYALQLNNTKVLNASVDALLLDSNTNEGLRKWLILFAESKMNEGKSWNFRRDIFLLGKELFSEKVKIYSQVLNEFTESAGVKEDYLKELSKIVRNFEAELTGIGHKGLDLMNYFSLNVDDFFQKKNGPAGYFLKITEAKDFTPKSYVKQAVADPEKWVSKSNPNRNELMEIALDKLHPLLKEAVDHYELYFIRYNTAKILLGQFYTLGILSDLQKNIQEYSRDQNEFLISDMASFLYKIIDNNDAPFIYEKTGSVFKHYFLDEFQDTSFIQWKNFKPLISNSLSTGYGNLVVGDIKQSIYRWRNSDWKILGESLYADFNAFDLAAETLDSNYRSKKNIVQFNNAFFSIAPSLLQEEFNAGFDPTLYDEEETKSMMNKINLVYENVVQKASRPHCLEGGQVRISFLKNEKDEKWKEKTDREFPLVISDLLQKGVEPGDIAILVRTHREGKRAVDALMKYREENDLEGDLNFPIMSNESLYLKNSSPVRFLICFLRYLDNPEDRLNLSELYFEYSTIKPGVLLIENRDKLTERLRSDIVSSIFTPEELNEISFLKKLSLPEILEGVIRLFSLGRNTEDVPYIQAFLGEVMDYARENPGDIVSFLNWWEEEGIIKSLTVPEGSNALQVLTIHKSKGLQFKYVFIPYADWRFDHAGNNTPVLWCEMSPKPYPFNELPVIPVKYSSRLIDSYLNKEYFHERLNSFIDNLNLLYVAFTRAEDALYIYGPENKKAISCVTDLIFSSLGRTVGNGTKEKAQLGSDLSKYWDPEKIQWQFGLRPEDCTVRKKYEVDSILLKEYHGWSGFSRMRLRYQGLEFFSEDRAEKIRKGTILHELFEHIGTTEDVRDAVRFLNEQGKIPSDEIKSYNDLVVKIISKPDVSDWFSGRWEVKSEAGILLKSGKTRRPDRIMIGKNEILVVDYKFGEIKSESHIEQVKGYIRNLKHMGYANVKGYLWYVELENVDEIKVDN